MTAGRRLDRLDVTVADPAHASADYQRNFGLKLRAAEGGGVILALGDAEIRLLARETGASGPSLTAGGAEGMAALWLEADDVEQVAEALARAGFKSAPIRVEGDRRVLAVAPESANQVPLFVFDRKR